MALIDERNPSLSLTGFREVSAEKIQADPTKVFPSSRSTPLSVAEMFVVAELLNKRSCYLFVVRSNSQTCVS